MCVIQGMLRTGGIKNDIDKDLKIREGVTF